MNIKKFSIFLLVLIFAMQMVTFVFADSDDDYDNDYISYDGKDEYGPGNLTGKKPEQKPIETTVAANGPEVVEYYDYTTPREVAPGSLSGDVNFDYVGRGLFHDGEDFYFFLDTGVLATEYMYNMEGDRFYFGDDGKMVKDQMEMDMIIIIIKYMN